MRRSLPRLTALCFVVALGACALRKLPEPPRLPLKPVYAGRSATLAVTNDIDIVGAVSMPSGFEPNAAYPPIWMSEGKEVAVAGSIGGKTIVLGFSGSEFADRRVVAEDFGVNAPGGRIVDVAASPGGFELATAVAAANQNELQVVTRETINPGEGHPIASVGGQFDLAQLVFLDGATLALVLRAPALSGEQTAAPAAATPLGGGIYLIHTSGQADVRHLDKLQCALSRLSFSPNRYFAIGQGDTATPPAVFDLHDGTCRALDFAKPVRVLSWTKESSAFLYRAAGEQVGAGIFRFDMTSGRSSLVAVSSGAAAYATDGTIVALGNRELSWRRAAQPSARVKAEIALFNPHTPEIKLNSLGFETTPALMAESSMVYSSASDDGVIDIAIPQAERRLRELIEYSYPARAAFVLASGPAQGPVMMSWSPDGKMIAIVDANQAFSMLTVLAPPR
jgi:hypothetical protein